MKKLLSILILAMSALSVQAKETVTIFYAWGPGDSVANYHRTLAYEANKIQSKYNFQFDTKPGAGGVLAVNHVLKETNAILAHSTAFFVRPVVFPNESYNLSALKEEYVHCMAPMAVTSSKYKSWDQVPADRLLTIGTSGLGVTTHLAAVQLQKRFPNAKVVPFKSTTDAMMSMVAQNTDFHIGFISEAEQWAKGNTNKNLQVTVLGITGSKVINGYTPLAKLGFDSSFAQMNVGHHLVVPANFANDKAKEIHAIFTKAAKTKAVRNAYAVDYCEPESVGYDDLAKFYSFHTEYWKKLSTGISVK